MNKQQQGEILEIEIESPGWEQSGLNKRPGRLRLDCNDFPLIATTTLCLTSATEGVNLLMVIIFRSGEVSGENATSMVLPV